MPRCALDLGAGRTALPGGAGGAGPPLTPSYFREPGGIASLPTPSAASRRRAGWISRFPEGGLRSRCVVGISIF